MELALQQWENRITADLQTLNLTVENADTLLKRLNTRIRRFEKIQEDTGADPPPDEDFSAPGLPRRGVLPMAR